MIFKIIFGKNKRVFSPKISVKMDCRICEGGFAENNSTISPKISVKMVSPKTKTFRTENNEQGDWVRKSKIDFAENKGGFAENFELFGFLNILANPVNFRKSQLNPQKSERPQSTCNWLYDMQTLHEK